jgi:predicted acyl esterase
VPFLLHHDGGLAEAPPAEGAAPLSWDSDPRHPVPTIGGAITSMEPVCSGGPYDQRERPEIFGCRPPYPPLASRADVLVFQTPPLEKEVEVIGPAWRCAARLVSCSASPGTLSLHPRRFEGLWGR